MGWVGAETIRTQKVNWGKGMPDCFLSGLLNVYNFRCVLWHKERSLGKLAAYPKRQDAYGVYINKIICIYFIKSILSAKIFNPVFPLCFLSKSKEFARLIHNHCRRRRRPESGRQMVQRGKHTRSIRLRARSRVTASRRFLNIKQNEGMLGRAIRCDPVGHERVSS